MAYEDIISLREFARRLGVDEKIIRRGIANGKIKDGVIVENGKPKIKFSVAIVEARNIGLGAKANAINDNSKPIKQAIKPAKHKPDPEDNNTPEITDNFDPDQEALSYADALKKKENYIAGIKKLEFLEKRKTLVNKSEVYSQLFDFGKEIRSEFESLPGKIGSKLADCGSDSSKISETLANEIRNSLSKLINNLANKALTK
ncbi:MAG: hypothetical protein ACOYN4_04855 [Bacteroidales bacterium]